MITPVVEVCVGRGFEWVTEEFDCGLWVEDRFDLRALSFVDSLFSKLALGFFELWLEI